MGLVMCGTGSDLRRSTGAPQADLKDGLFDAVVIGDVNLWDLATQLPRLYRGAHLKHPKVSVHRTKVLTLEATDSEPVPISVDGESFGQLPADFEVMPRALRLRF